MNLHKDCSICTGAGETYEDKNGAFFAVLNQCENCQIEELIDEEMEVFELIDSFKPRAFYAE